MNLHIFLIMENRIALSLKNINKNFPGVKALDNVSLDFFVGEVHSICGENGAGKSSLMKILSGVYSLDSGEISINEKNVKIKNSNDALNNGISIIFQEFNLIDVLSIAENIFIGRLSNDIGSWINWKDINKKTKDLLKKVGCNLSPTTLVKDLSVAEKQMVEIAKALSYNARIIIMDEPTSSLTDNEVDRLFNIIKDLKKNNVTVIYISHKLEEVMKLSDRITIMRDGKLINTVNIEDANVNSIIEQMVGRPINQDYPHRIQYSGEKDIVLEVRNLTRNNVFSNISFSLKKGEVLGLAGLVGSGRTEIARAIFGADKLDAGSTILHGKNIKITNPNEAIRNGIALLTEDRKKQGLHLSLSIEKNISCVNLKGISKNIFLLSNEERKVSNNYIKKLSIKAQSEKQRAIYLSGGNQQKVVLAKWLYANSEIIILDEPTRGIDVGAKLEIYNLMNNLVTSGKSIIMISSELPELLAMCDRVLVIHEGRIKGELSGNDMNAEMVMKKILNEADE